MWNVVDEKKGGGGTRGRLAACSTRGLVSALVTEVYLEGGGGTRGRRAAYATCRKSYTHTLAQPSHPRTKTVRLKQTLVCTR